MAERKVVVELQVDDKNSTTAFARLTKALTEARLERTALNKAIRDNDKEYRALEKTMSTAAGANEENRQTLKENRQEFDKLTKTLAQTDARYENLRLQHKVLRNEISGATKAGLTFSQTMANSVAAGVERVVSPAFDSLKKQLNDARIEAQKAYQQFGAGSKEFKEAAKRADDLDNSLKFVNSSIGVMGEEGKLEAVGKLARGIAAASSAAELFGENGEDVAASLLKIQRALAIGESIKAIIDAAKAMKVFGASLGFVTTAQTTTAAATTATTAATTAQTAATGGATLATRALGAAMNALPLIAIVSAVTLLVQAFIALSDETEDAVKANDRLNESLDRIRQRNQGARDAITQERLANAELRMLAEGRTEENEADIAERTRIELQGISDRLALNREAFAQQEALYREAQEKEKTATGENLKQAIANRADAWNKIADLDAEAEDLRQQAAALEKMSEVERARFIVDQEKKRTEEAKKESEKRIAQAKKEAAEKRKAEQQFDAESMTGTGLELFGGSELPKTEDRLKNADAVIDKYNQEAMAAATSAAVVIEAEQAKAMAVQEFGNAFGAVADLIGRKTAEGKAIASAQALINTYLGVTQVLGNKTVLPEPFGTINKIAGVATVLATGLAAVANINNTGFADGGYTPRRGSDSAPVGVVHANEYVVPARMVRDGRYAPLLAELERGRQRLGYGMANGSYAVGGTVRGTALVNFPTVPSGVIRDADFTRALQSMNITPQVAVTDITRAMQRVNVQEQRSTL